MTTDLPAGFIDPAAPEQVAPVLAAVLQRIGVPGLVDVLARMPGVGVHPGRSAGLLRRAEPPRVRAGEHGVVLSAPPVQEHVVGGIVLSRTTLTSASLPAVLAAVVAAGVTTTGRADDASVALTAARDAVAPPGA